MKAIIYKEYGTADVLHLAVVDKVYAPEQAADAHRRAETEQRIGSVVFSFMARSEP
jgi:hypothetical protein